MGIHRVSLQFLDDSTKLLIPIAVRISRVKYLIHRVTYQQLYGDIANNMDISHVLYLGRNTSRQVTSLTLHSSC